MLWRYILPALLWAICVFIITIFPSRNLPEVEVWQFDKVVHFCSYAGLTFLVANGLAKQYQYPRLRYLSKTYSLVAGILYGFIMESIQGVFLNDRSFEIMDLVANSVGCLGGLFIFTAVYYKLK